MPTPLQPALFPVKTAFAQVTGSRSLQLTAPQRIPAQQRFNKLLAKAQTLTEHLADTRALADTFRPLYSSTLQPLQAQRKAGLRSMAVWLDQWLQKKNAGSALRRDATARLCSLSEALAADGDAEMRALHDRHSSMSWRDKQEAAAADKRAMLQQTTGLNMSDRHSAESAHDLLQAGMERAGQHRLDEQTAFDATTAAGRASKPTPDMQQKALDHPQNAPAALRAIYRQLASALHPDREQDATARGRKTELMGQANTAYARRDLMALLALQCHCEPLDAMAVSRTTVDKVAALMTLLKAQVASLKEDAVMAQEQLRGEFRLSDFTPLTAQGLTFALNEQAGVLAAATTFIQQDLQRVKTDTGLKSWLKAQHKQSGPVSFVVGFDVFFDSGFGSSRSR